MRAAVVLLNRDLRVHDHPALAAACAEAEHVVPLFVLDEELRGAGFVVPNRAAFLCEALTDLDASLRARGGRLVVRRGDPVAEAVRSARAAGAQAVFASADVSRYARSRERRLEAECGRERLELRTFPGVAVVEAGELAPQGGDHFRVFTPYWRRWAALPRRAPQAPPRRVVLPPEVEPGTLPTLVELAREAVSPGLPAGGETAGRRRLAGFLRSGLARYGERHDDLPGDATSRLSPYLHLGCLSPLELAERAGEREGAEPFLRQLCWRDFAHQLLAASPDLPREDYRPRSDRWRDDPDAYERWRAGRTGYPVVDAGLRQLAREGWMHNRARLLVASFLVKDLRIDWRLGARHFLDLLVDGDLASNSANWQWVAGTGTDTRPNRIFDPVAQGKRFDPDGEYVRRHVPELAGVEGAGVHEPWRLPAETRRRLDYPEPLVDHAEAAAEFLAGRRRDGARFAGRGRVYVQGSGSATTRRSP